KVTKESSFLPAQGPPSGATQKHLTGSAVESALTGHTGLGSRTHCHNAPFNKQVQPLKAPAQRYALPKGMQGKPTEGLRGDTDALVETDESANKHRQTRMTGRRREALRRSFEGLYQFV
ncbi:hypothetical protein, partial [Caballeronia sp. LZ034LL]|uniref:hypothetical protein n=1 Tax=Caballeronia sp. LZ034LL TaxID=3038567 RepID=UPI00286698EF